MQMPACRFRFRFKFRCRCRYAHADSRSLVSRPCNNFQELFQSALPAYAPLHPRCYASPHPIRVLWKMPHEQPVGMYVCMCYACGYVCMCYACGYVCMHVLCLWVCMHVLCNALNVRVCTHGSMYMSIFVLCIYGCVHVCVCVYVCVCVCVCVCVRYTECKVYAGAGYVCIQLDLVCAKVRCMNIFLYAYTYINA